MDIYRLLYQAGMPHVLRRLLKPSRLTILSLHRITDEPSFFWSPVKPAVFEQLCAYAARHYTVTSFAELSQHRSSKKPLLIFSFDDGYHDFIEYALPALHKYNLPSNHNYVYRCVEENMTIWTQRLNTVFDHLHRQQVADAAVQFEDDTHASLAQAGGNWNQWYNQVFKKLLRSPIAEREPVLDRMEQQYGVKAAVRMMNWDDVQEAIRYKTEPGNHSYSHEAMPTVLDPDAFHREVIWSKQQFEERLQVPFNIFALPNGETTPDITARLGTAGYRYVLELNEKTNTLHKGAINSPQYHRITIGGEPIERVLLRTETFQSTLHSFIK
jgi:peptidoglycan/xylan/chitin deacetylase (PgdA/CDA1 family)